MAETIREQIVQKLMAVVEAAVDGSAATLLQGVIRGANLTSASNVQLPVAGISEGEEEVFLNVHPFADKHLELFVTFRFPHEKGVAPENRFNYYLGWLLKAIMADTTLGDLSMDLIEQGTTPDIDGPDDPSSEGTISLLVRYRVRSDDPFTGT